MSQVPYSLNQYAQQASSQTGLNPLVILSQWIAENGWTVPKNNNFGNIMVPGTHTLETYSTPAAGVQAYVNFLKQNSNYKGILATAGQPAQTQLYAIVSSPWDAGHYGGNGQNLFNVYNQVSNSSIALPSGVSGPSAPTSTDTVTPTTAPAVGVANQLTALQGVTNPTDAGWAAQAQSIGIMLLIAILGMGLLFMGLKMVSGGAAKGVIE